MANTIISIVPLLFMRNRRYVGKAKFVTFRESRICVLPCKSLGLAAQIRGKLDNYGSGG
jgi:hypothetical protein